MASTDATKPADKAQSDAGSGAPPADTQNKPTSTALGEDDEFEDFPVDDWPEEQTEAAQQQQGGSGEAKHLWEESWDDDDTSDDFSQQLKEELKKVDAAKRR